MQIRTDDDVYRVDAVWLGPPRATFPWRARYSSYGVGLVVMILVMFVQRRLGISLGFFSVAWALLITVVVVRFVGRRINEDRPLLEWLALFVHELRGPRRRTRGTGAGLDTGHVQIEAARPRAALPPGRTDPQAALAVPAPAAPARVRRPGRGRVRRPWTTRSPDPVTAASAGTAAGTSRPAGATGAGRGRPGRPGTGRDRDGVVRVPARRADRPTGEGDEGGSAGV